MGDGEGGGGFRYIYYGFEGLGMVMWGCVFGMVRTCTGDRREEQEGRTGGRTGGNGRDEKRGSLVFNERVNVEGCGSGG